MKVIILKPAVIGLNSWQPRPYAQEVSEEDGQQLIDAGAARAFETKVVEATEKKSSSASPRDQASPEGTQKKRRGRPPKSSQSTTATD